MNKNKFVKKCWAVLIALFVGLTVFTACEVELTTDDEKSGYHHTY